MYKTLYFLRHGETTANVERVWVDDPPLSDLGLKQVQYWANYFAHNKPGKILSSPKIRTKQTAKIIAKKLEFVIEIDPDLVEVNGGILVGKSVDTDLNNDTHRNVLKFWQKGEDASRYPNGESLGEVELRLNRFAERLMNTKDDSLLIVSHTLIMATFFWLFCDNKRQNILDNQLSRGSMAKVILNKDKFVLDAFNIKPQVV